MTGSSFSQSSISSCVSRWAVALLLVEGLAEDLVDEPQGGADGERAAVGLEDAGMARVDRHAGTDRGLGEVDRGDVAVLEYLERPRQLGAKAARKSRRIAAGTSAGRGRQASTM
jgi:hypothetical protein